MPANPREKSQKEKFLQCFCKFVTDGGTHKRDANECFSVRVAFFQFLQNTISNSWRTFDLEACYNGFIQTRMIASWTESYIWL